MFPQVRTDDRPLPEDAKPLSLATTEVLQASLLHVVKALEQVLAGLGSKPGRLDEEGLRLAAEELRCAKGALQVTQSQGEMPAAARAAHAAQRADPAHSPHFGG